MRTSIACKEGGWWSETEACTAAEVLSSTGNYIRIRESKDGVLILSGDDIKVALCRDGVVVETTKQNPKMNLSGD